MKIIIIIMRVFLSVYPRQKSGLSQVDFSTNQTARNSIGECVDGRLIKHSSSAVCCHPSDNLKKMNKRLCKNVTSIFSTFKFACQSQNVISLLLYLATHILET